MIPFISFWQSCPACWSSPLHVTLINSFITEMLWTIKTIGSEAPYAGKYVPPSRFDSGKFVAPKQSLLSKTTRRARETLWSALAVRRIHLEFSDLANIWDSLAVIARNKTVIRDRNKVGNIEQIINKKKYELSVWWWRTDKIAWVTLDNMKDIIERYKWLWVLAAWTEVNAWSEYGDLIMLLWRTSSSLKHLVALGGENRAAKEKEITFQLRKRGRTAIEIEKNAIEQINSDYQCTKMYACEDSRWSIQEEIKKIWEIYKNWRNGAKTEIKRANSELVKAYSKENLKKIVTENAIFNQLSWAINEVKDIGKRAKYEMENSAVYQQIQVRTDSNWTESSNNWTTTTTTSDWKFTHTPSQKWDPTINDIIKKTTATITTWDLKKEEIINNFTTRITNSIALIKNEKQNTTNKYWALDKPDHILWKFIILSERINVINNDIIGSKDIDNCLIKNLWLLCEKQCSNIFSKKCYY